VLDLREAVPAALLVDPSVKRVVLVGSRARGNPTPLSDWDFEVTAAEPARLARRLPRLIRPLQPLAAGWDPNGERPTQFLLLAGARKVDLVMPQLRQPSEGGVHRVTRERLRTIDHHFWDWVLWLGSKQLRGEMDRVRGELARMSHQLLEPLGVDGPPAAIADAVAAYRAAYAATCRQLGARRRLRLDREVSAALERHGLIDRSGYGSLPPFRRAGTMPPRTR
jgi:hypothetical protein